MSFYVYVEQIGGKIFHRWIDDKGKQRAELSNFCPTLYTKTKKPNPEFHGIRGEALERKNFDDIWKAKDFVKRYKEVENFPIYGNQNWWAQFIQEEYTGPVDWKNTLVVAGLDIEVRMDKGFPHPNKAESEITCISVGVFGSDIHTFATKPYEGKRDDFIFTYCVDELELILNFLKLWKKLEPNVVTGWNTTGFDIPYLVNRIRKLAGNDVANLLAPTASKFTKKCIKESQFKGNDEYVLHGINDLDYLRVYKKFTRTEKESYKLDYIAKEELGEQKLDYSGYRNLDDLWERNPSRYIEYNAHDVRLVERLDKKLNLFNFIYQLSYMCHVRFNDVFGQVRMWDALIYNKLIDNNIVIPPKNRHEKDSKYRGAFVIEPIVGMHEWVVSFDLNSLYPHLIMHYGISPEKLLEYEDLDGYAHTNEEQKAVDVILKHWNHDSRTVNINVDDTSAGKALPVLDAAKKLNLSITANGSLYNRNIQGFLPEMMNDFYADRAAVKKKMLAAEQDIEDIEVILRERGVL